VTALQFGDAESKNGSTKPPDRETVSFQGMETCGVRYDTAETNLTVIAMIQKRQPLNGEEENNCPE